MRPLSNTAYAVVTNSFSSTPPNDSRRVEDGANSATYYNQGLFNANQAQSISAQESHPNPLNDVKYQLSNLPADIRHKICAALFLQQRLQLRASCKAVRNAITEDIVAELIKVYKFVVKTSEANEITAVLSGIQAGGLSFFTAYFYNNHLESRVTSLQIHSWVLQIDREWIKQLTNLLNKLHNLTHLDLTANKIGDWNDKDVKMFAEAITRLPRLANLNLTANKMYSNAAIKKLIKVLAASSNLTHLDLTANKIGLCKSEEATLLANTMQGLSRLAYLKLRDTCLHDGENDDEVKNFATVLAASSNLTYLDLTANKIGDWNDKEVTMLAGAIQDLPKLTYFGITLYDSNNDDEVQTLIKVLAAANNLTHLDLNGVCRTNVRAAVYSLYAISCVLKDAPRLTSLTLKSMDLHYNTTQGFDDFIQFLIQNTIVSLDLSDISGITNEQKVCVINKNKENGNKITIKFYDERAVI